MVTIIRGGDWTDCWPDLLRIFNAAGTLFLGLVLLRLAVLTVRNRRRRWGYLMCGYLSGVVLLWGVGFGQTGRLGDPLEWRTVGSVVAVVLGLIGAQSAFRYDLRIFGRPPRQPPKHAAVEPPPPDDDDTEPGAGQEPPTEQEPVDVAEQNGGVR